MTHINDLELTWEKVAWNISNRISTDIAKIVGWGELYYLETNTPPIVVVEFDDKECKISIHDLKTYTGTTFPTDAMKNKIAKSLLKNHEENGDIYSNILLDRNYKLFAGRAVYNSEWVYLGIENEDWQPLNFDSFRNWFNNFGDETAGPDLYWRIGNQLLRTASMYSERVLGTIVLADYCDKFVPKKDGEVKPVSFSGFATLVMFLRKIVGDKRTITTRTLKSLYNDFDVAKVIPVIPTTWKTKDIELMNMRRLDVIINELEDKAEKEKEDEKSVCDNGEEKEELKNSGANWEEDSDKDLEKDSAIITISKMIEDAKNLIKNQITLAKADPDDEKSFVKNKAIALSKILSGQILLNSEIWGGEFLIDIDTNITEGGISISENEMLVAIISYGLLEILVEDSVQRELCTELEKNIEEKYGIAVQFLGINSPDRDSVEAFLKKGNEINVKS